MTNRLFWDVHWILESEPNVWSMLATNLTKCSESWVYLMQGYIQNRTQNAAALSVKSFPTKASLETASEKKPELTFERPLLRQAAEGKALLINMCQSQKNYQRRQLEQLASRFKQSASALQRVTRIRNKSSWSEFPGNPIFQQSRHFHRWMSLHETSFDRWSCLWLSLAARCSSCKQLDSKSVRSAGNMFYLAPKPQLWILLCSSSSWEVSKISWNLKLDLQVIHDARKNKTVFRPMFFHTCQILVKSRFSFQNDQFHISSGQLEFSSPKIENIQTCIYTPFSDKPVYPHGRYSEMRMYWEYIMSIVRV